MAIAYDAGSSNDAAGTSSPLTFNHTVGSGSNRLLIVIVDVFNSGGAAEPAVTFDGVSMGAARVSAGSGVVIVYLFALANPNSGTKTISITATGTNDLAALGDSFTGVDQVTPIAHTASGTGTGTGPSTDVTSVAGNWAYDGISWFNTTGTVGGGQTPRTINENGTSVESVDSSTEDGAATVTMSWTLAASRAWRQVLVDIQADAVVVSNAGSGLLVRGVQ